jgi:Flp pilus assembly protein TadG
MTKMAAGGRPDEVAENTCERRCSGERGATFIALVAATGVALVVVVGIIQVIVFQYGKGTVRAALDEAARAGARSTASVPTCQERAADVLGDLLAGTLGDGVEVSCADDGERIVVTASVHFDGWFGPLTDYDAVLTASAAKEDR